MYTQLAWMPKLYREDEEPIDAQEGRRIKRTSDRAQVLGGNTGPVSRSCQDCKTPLYILPQDQKNYMCLECGQKYPIEQQ